MALVNCHECGKEISDKAQSCPSCGCPIQNTPTASQSNASQQVGVQTIQETSKKWKGMQLIGAILLVIGIISCINQTSTGSLTESPVTGVLIFLGFIFSVIGKFGAWWHHR